MTKRFKVELLATAALAMTTYAPPAVSGSYCNGRCPYWTCEESPTACVVPDESTYFGCAVDWGDWSLCCIPDDGSTCTQLGSGDGR